MMNALRPFFVPLSTQKEKMRTIRIFALSRIAAMQSDPAAGPGLQSAIGYLTLWGQPTDSIVEIWPVEYPEMFELLATYRRDDKASHANFTIGAIFRRNRENATWEFHS